ncbi:hypothetical protein ACVW19_001954 [Streptomyces sp. TE5632]
MAAQRVSARMSGTSVAVPAAAAVAAVITRTPLGSTGRNTSSRTERATTA